MKRALIISGIVIGVGAIIFAISKAVSNQYQKLMNYCYNLAGYNLHKLAIDNINFDVNMEVKNNSDIQVELLSYNLLVYLNDIKVATVISNKSQLLPANKLSNIIINVDIVPSKIREFDDPGAIANVLLGFKNTRLKISGTIAGRALGIKVQEPVFAETTIKYMLPSSEQPKVLCA